MSRIEFTKEQSMLLDIATKFFRERSTIEDVRSQLTTETGFDATLWQEIAELGWLGIAVPEEHGGIGQGVAELVTIVEPMGRHLFASPFMPTQLTIQALCAGGSEGQRKAWLPRLAEGTIATPALIESEGNWNLEQPECRAEAQGKRIRFQGTKCFVADAQVAELVLASVTFDGELALVLLERADMPEDALARQVVIDETRRSYRLRLDGIEVARDRLMVGAAAKAALWAVRNAGLLLVSAEACGGTAGALDVVLEYLKSRQQFGRLIGSYQALKHPTVDILTGLERARSHLYHAATVYKQPEAETALRMAKAESSDAFAFAGDRAIQFHGGFGFTYECDAQLYLRRALWCQYQFGDASHHRKKLAEVLLA